MKILTLKEIAAAGNVISRTSCGLKLEEEAHNYLRPDRVYGKFEIFVEPKIERKLDFYKETENINRHGLSEDKLNIIG